MSKLGHPNSSLGWFLLFILYQPSQQSNIISYQTNSTDSTNGCFKKGIKISCFHHFLKTASPTLNDTSSENFFAELWRKIKSEVDVISKSRHKRQIGAPVRREVRAAPYETNFLRYAQAVRRLKNHFGVRFDMNTYDLIASIHTGGAMEHRGPAFFSWHRIYLLLYEAALQSVFGQGVTVPYWDSSLDFEMGDRQARTILFSDRYFGSPLGRVTSGFFAQLPGQPIFRAINSRGGLISKAAIAEVLTRRSHSEIIRPDASRFCWECYHNGVHNWVDATMANGRTAAYDPVFWCHHAFVDYVWELFRSRLEDAPADYPLGSPLHPPTGQMRFNNYRYQPNPPITNRDGYSNRYARLRRYASGPSCENNCGGSQDLYCNETRNVCISSEIATFAFGAFSGGRGAAPGVVELAAGSVEPITTSNVLREIKAEFDRTRPPGPQNLFPLSFVDPNTRTTSVLDF